MTTAESNTDFNPLQMRVEKLWKEYAELFNNFDPEREAEIKDRMDYLLQEIRNTESKIEKLESRDNGSRLPDSFFQSKIN